MGLVNMDMYIVRHSGMAAEIPFRLKLTYGYELYFSLCTYTVAGRVLVSNYIENDLRREDYQPC